MEIFSLVKQIDGQTQKIGKNVALNRMCVDELNYSTAERFWFTLQLKFSVFCSPLTRFLSKVNNFTFRACKIKHSRRQLQNELIAHRVDQPLFTFPSTSALGKTSDLARAQKMRR